MFTRRELKLRYRHSVLDGAWALISQAVTAAVYGIVLTQSFDVQSTCAPYLTSAWVGLVAWTFFASSIGGSVGSLINAHHLISKVYFPREALPLAMVGASFLDLFVGFVTLAGVMAVQGVSVGVMALATILPLLLLIVWSAALSIWSALIAAFFRDAYHGIGLALRVGFFASPVMYESAHLPAAFEWTKSINPVAVTIDGMRSTLLCGEAPNLALLGAHALAAVIVLVAGVAHMARVESSLADVT